MSEIRPTQDDIEFLLENRAFQAYAQDVHTEWEVAMNGCLDASELDPLKSAFNKGKFHALDFVKRGVLERIAIAAKVDDHNREIEKGT